MKKITFTILMLAFLLFPNMNPKALRPYQVAEQFACEKIELANAKEDGTLEKVECYDNYETAKQAMNVSTNDGAVLIEDGKIINAKYAVVDYDIGYPKGHPTGYTRVYKDNSTSTIINYITTSSHFGDDAPLLDFDYNTKMVKIKLSGLVGWIRKNDDTGLMLYDIVPITWVKTPIYYQVNSSGITHYFPWNVYNDDQSKAAEAITIDKKPSMLQDGKYYSYDGHYFYTSLKTMIDDYKNGNYNNSVNKNEPYFNYYQYLSFRTKTTYNADNINEYIKKRTGEKSKLRNTGSYFTWVQENYGINALLMLSIGINESGWGNSDISQNNNNLFGLNAIDATPGQSANYFSNVETCIKDYGYKWMSYWYIQPGDSHYKGANLGNKLEGLNVKYASDPYWGEKAAAHYYQFDKSYGFQDYKNYETAVLNNNYSDKVYATKTINGEKVEQYNTKKYYQYTMYGQAIVILEKVEVDNNIWYKIQSEPVLDENKNYIGESTSNPRINYNWNSYVYVPASYFYTVSNKITDVTHEESKPDQKPEEQQPDILTEQQPTIVYKDINKIVEEASYKINNKMISGIKLGLKTDEIIKNLKAKEAKEVSVQDSKGNNKTGTLSTGDKITINNGETKETFEVVIYGDINGDGNIDKMDCSEILRYFYGYVKYDGAKNKALDVNKDGKVDKVDAAQVLRKFYGYAEIEQ